MKLRLQSLINYKYTGIEPNRRLPGRGGGPELASQGDFCNDINFSKALCYGLMEYDYGGMANSRVFNADFFIF